jgi:hypothetical protein
MIDIHPPQHAPMTKRDFFVHLFIVILGILIAIGLEQAVEFLHHCHLASEARSHLRTEAALDERSNNFNIFVTRLHQQFLQRDLVILHAARAHSPLPPGPFILHHARFLYPEGEWTRIHETGTINFLTENLAGLPYRYQNQEAFMTHVDRSNEDLYRAGAVLRSENDLLQTTFEKNVATNNFLNSIADNQAGLTQQELDRGFASFAETANFSALSPAQIDSLEHAIEIALVDDDALLTDCYNIKRNLANHPDH